MHGTAILRESILNIEGNVWVEKGEEGIVTAYLPEMETFAVIFTNDRWATFSETEESFVNNRVFYKK
jgi:hypothetical protein